METIDFVCYNLLNSFICSNSFFSCGIFRVFYIHIRLDYPQTDSFTLDAFISLSCLIAQDRTSNTVLNKRGESKLLCLVPDLREKNFSLLLLNMILAVCFSHMAFILLR